MLRRVFCASLMGLAATLAQANEPTFPSKPIKIVVPSQAGGLLDALARQLANAAQARLGQPVVIDNRPGASGNIGAELVAKAPADGYTLLFTLESSLPTGAALFSKLNYDPQKDLRVVSAIGMNQAVWLVRSGLPVTTLTAFADYVKAHPGKVSIAGWGPGSSPHVIQTVMDKELGMTLLHVPYKGEAPTMSAILSGEVDFATTSPMLAQQNLATGKYRLLAVSGKTRSPVFPNVPTVTEAGLKHEAFEGTSAATLFAPKGLPPQTLAALGQAFAAATRDAGPAGFMATMGVVPMGTTPQEGQRAHDAYFVVQRRLVESTGVKLD